MVVVVHFIHSLHQVIVFILFFFHGSFYVWVEGLDDDDGGGIPCFIVAESEQNTFQHVVVISLSQSVRETEESYLISLSRGETERQTV